MEHSEFTVDTIVTNVQQALTIPDARPPERPRMSVRLNRNFMNFPLARDRRAGAQWIQGGPHRSWSVYLPGENRKAHRIKLSLPCDTPLNARRYPTALDINVLCQLLAEAQRQDGTATMQFESFAVLRRRLGMSVRNRERARVEASLVYWTRLTIEWPRWYEKKRHKRLVLPPPIKFAKRQGNRITLTLHEDWYRLARTRRYGVDLPLPLPQEPAAQNLFLLVLTRPMVGDLLDAADAKPNPALFDRTAPVTKPMQRWWIARKLGLTHKHRNSVLDRAVVLAERCFADNGGRLKSVRTPPDEDGYSPSQEIAFRYIKPEAVTSVISSMGRRRGLSSQHATR